MGRFIDLTGQVFGLLTVVKLAEQTKWGLKWFCRCECGTYKAIARASLRKGTTISCGCFRNQKNTELRTTHGESKSRLYKTWLGMRARTGNPNEAGYR